MAERHHPIEPALYVRGHIPRGPWPSASVADEQNHEKTYTCAPRPVVPHLTAIYPTGRLELATAPLWGGI